MWLNEHKMTLLEDCITKDWLLNSCHRGIHEAMEWGNESEDRNETEKPNLGITGYLESFPYLHFSSLYTEAYI